MNEMALSTPARRVSPLGENATVMGSSRVGSAVAVCNAPVLGSYTRTNPSGSAVATHFPSSEKTVKQSLQTEARCRLSARLLCPRHTRRDRRYPPGSGHQVKTPSGPSAKSRRTSQELASTSLISVIRPESAGSDMEATSQMRTSGPMARVHFLGRPVNQVYEPLRNSQKTVSAAA
jgi:hypothetical protein